MTNKQMDRATVLTEALPYIQKYSGRTVVVKYGGEAMISEELRNAVISDIILLHLVGIRVVVVHGAGPEVDALLKEKGITPRYQDGVCCLNAQEMQMLQQVLCGKVNKDIVATMHRIGGNAMGISGIDGGILTASGMGEAYGCGGSITAVNATPIAAMLDGGYVPVVAAVAADVNDETMYCLNADAAAAKLAVALGAERLLLLADANGVLNKASDESSLISKIQLSEVPALVQEGVIAGDMVSRVNCGVEAARSGVKASVILDGRVPHSILLELLSDAGNGTMLAQ